MCPSECLSNTVIGRSPGCRQASAFRFDVRLKGPVLWRDAGMLSLDPPNSFICTQPSTYTSRASHCAQRECGSARLKQVLCTRPLRRLELLVTPIGLSVLEWRRTSHLFIATELCRLLLVSCLCAPLCPAPFVAESLVFAGGLHLASSVKRLAFDDGMTTACINREAS